MRSIWRNAIFGSLALVVMACCLYVVGVVRGGFSTRTLPSGFETAVAVSARSLASPSKARNLRNPAPSSPEVIAEAKAHWADHCAQCHANNGSGETELGRNLYPRPPDMRQQETQKLTDGELYSTIKNGVRLSGMPAFGTPGDDDLDSWKLVDFVRYLPKMSEEESSQMEKLNPKTADELNEEQMEDQFLNGTESAETHKTGRKH